jgi:hypothetical protein
MKDMLLVTRAAKNRPPELFASAKTATQIPVTHPLVREALVQASLNSSVLSIGCVAASASGSGLAEMILFTQEDGEYYLDIVPRHAAQLTELGEEARRVCSAMNLRPLVITEQEIMSQPRLDNARQVWTCAHLRVAASLRLQISDVLAEDGPTSLRTLLSSLRSSSDPLPAVFAMVCGNELEIDLLSAPLGPSSTVRLRR